MGKEVINLFLKYKNFNFSFRKKKNVINSFFYYNKNLKNKKANITYNKHNNKHNIY